jgi:type IV fimbrial biogenesis protein FimT
MSMFFARTPRRHSVGGFTLVELLVVMAIAAILLTIGVPSYTATTSKYRVSTEVNSLVGDLQYARSEAIKQGVTVTVCTSTDGATCSGATSWASGHVVLTNPTNAATPTTATGAVLLRTQAAFSGTDTATSAAAAISFNRDGFAGAPSGLWNSFASLQNPALVTVHDKNNTTGVGSCVVISKIGQVSFGASGTTIAGQNCT